MDSRFVAEHASARLRVVVTTPTGGADRRRSRRTCDRLPASGEASARRWLINPSLRTLEVFRLVDGQWLLLAIYRDDQRVRAAPFEAIEIELATLWVDLATPPPRAGRASEGAATCELTDEL